MLPGFRLLAITVAFAAAMLVFGLGTAALLRTTHEEFAAIPLRTLQTPFSSIAAETPTLAVLEVAPPAEQPAAVPSPPALAPVVDAAEHAAHDSDTTVPRVIIPDPPVIPVTDGTATASIEIQQEPIAKPADISAAVIKARRIARKHAALRARAQARLHHRRRVVRPRPAPQPVEQSFFPLFGPTPDPAAAAVTGTNTARR